jgi:hypothetical protein
MKTEDEMRRFEVPEFVRLPDGSWCLPGSLTVAGWKRALEAAERPTDPSSRPHTRAQKRGAMQVLQLAAEKGMGDDTNVFQALGIPFPFP